ncbi:MAG: PQQ-dependent sugar dehydrogenase [Capsulimonadales bacterium]|nr:PQQ-dependent sugar dehydrogenase [Capsulimonadales bacterium]
MLKRTGIALFLLMLSCPVSAQTVSDNRLRVTTYLTGFTQPTQLRFLGYDDVLITEKSTGRVIRSRGGVRTTLLDLNVANNSERGLLGLTLDPQFATNKQVYVYYSRSGTVGDGSTWAENRLSRFTFDGTALVNEQLLRTFGSATDGQNVGPNHDGGPILFGPDGKLYGVVGDLNRIAAEQNNTGTPNRSSLVGGVYRLNPDGTIPTDNPFASNANPDFRPWFSYGVRNSYGLTFDPLTGNLWDTENGPGTNDEINMVTPGMNSGWLTLMGPSSRNPTAVPRLLNLPGSAYVDPKFTFLNPIGITALTFLANTRFGNAYQNGLLVGDNNNGSLYLFRLNAARNGFVLSGDLADLVADSVTERNLNRFGSGFGAVTDLQVGPDNAIYVTSFTQGRVFRIAAISPEPSALLLLASTLLIWLAVAANLRRQSP